LVDLTENLHLILVDFVPPEFEALEKLGYFLQMFCGIVLCVLFQVIVDLLDILDVVIASLRMQSSLQTQFAEVLLALEAQELAFPLVRFAGFQGVNFI
jgi:hypothetical protein